jgi:hypothetical protein
LAGGMNLYAYVGNDPVNATDPSGEIINNVAGGFLNAGVGAAINIGASLWKGESISWGKVGKDAAIDFGVGFASSGVAVAGKIGKVLTWANTTSAKFGTAFGGELIKATYSNDNSAQVTSSAIFNGVLNASGVTGKLADALLSKPPLPRGANPTRYAPSAGSTAAAKGVIEAHPSLVLGATNEYIKNQFADASPSTNNSVGYSGASSSSQNQQSFAALSAPQGASDSAQWGTNLFGDYTSQGVLSCVKCKF